MLWGESLNLLEVRELNACFIFDLTFAVGSLVRVLLLSYDRNMLSVVVGIFNKATTAAVVSVRYGAIDDLLLR